MSTLFESVNKHNRHTFRNCMEFIFDVTGYSINFRKLAFDGTLLDKTDTWIGNVGIFKTTCRRREMKIKWYCIGYIRMCVVVRNMWFLWMVGIYTSCYVVGIMSRKCVFASKEFVIISVSVVLCSIYMLKQITVVCWSAYSSVMSLYWNCCVANHCGHTIISFSEGHCNYHYKWISCSIRIVSHIVLQYCLLPVSTFVPVICRWPRFLPLFFVDTDISLY